MVEKEQFMGLKLFDHVIDRGGGGRSGHRATRGRFKGSPMDPRVGKLLSGERTSQQTRKGWLRSSVAGTKIWGRSSRPRPVCRPTISTKDAPLFPRNMLIGWSRSYWPWIGFLPKMCTGSSRLVGITSAMASLLGAISTVASPGTNGKTTVWRPAGFHLGKIKLRRLIFSLGCRRISSGKLQHTPK